MRTDPLIQRAAELWDAGATFPGIAEELHVDREAIRLGLESRRLFEWRSGRTADAAARDCALLRQGAALAAEVEAFLAGPPQHKESH